MFGVCYQHPGNGYYRTQWLCNVTAFNPDKVWEIGLPENMPNLEGVIGIQTASELPHNLELVALSPETARFVKPVTNLIDFEHPKDACYFFGADTRLLDYDDFGTREPDHVVYVPNQSSRECDELYSFVIGAIVLYDRLLKEAKAKEFYGYC